MSVCSSHQGATQRIFKGYWSIPGGKLEYGEHIFGAVQREIREETGMTVKFAGLRGVVSEALRGHISGAINGHFLIWVCGLNHVGGEPQEKNEGEVKRFNNEELDKEKTTIIPSACLMVNRFVFGNAPAANFHTVHMRSTGKGYEIEHMDL